jgi:hypothetical protein
MIKSWRMRWVRHVALMGEEISAYEAWLRNVKRNTVLHRRRWGIVLKWVVKE